MMPATVHPHARVATVCPTVSAAHRRGSRCPAALRCARATRLNAALFVALAQELHPRAADSPSWSAC